MKTLTIPTVCNDVNSGHGYITEPECSKVLLDLRIAFRDLRTM